MLQGDSRLILIDGRYDSIYPLSLLNEEQNKVSAIANRFSFCSDTTASTLTHIFYHLAQDPQHVDRLRLEIFPQIDASDGIVPVKLQDLNYLNGIINETLRLHPPVPTSIPRLTPPKAFRSQMFIYQGVSLFGVRHT